MSANEDFLDSLLKSVTDDGADGVGEVGSIDMDALMADMESLDLDSLDLDSLGLDTLGDISELGESVPQTENASDSSNLEEALTMTQEEIEQLLRETQEASEEPSEDRFDVNGDDLSQLLSGLDGEAGESGDEISALLQKADNNEVIDEEMADMMMQEEAYDDGGDLFLASLGEEEETEKKGLFGKKKKEKKPKEKKQKEKRKGKKAEQPEVQAEEEEAEAYVETLEIDAVDIPEKPKKEKKAKKEKKEKKGGLGSKFATLFADDGEDAADEILATLQEQNDAILMEMQAEDNVASKKKEKAAKKEKKKKEKPNKEEKEKKKQKKEKKPKKEKITKIEPLEKEPKQYFPAKKAMTIVAVCLMLMAAFIVLNNALASHSIGIQAKEAYEDEKYMECYQLLIGQDMTPEQEKMFYRSELILQMRLFKQHVNEYLSAGQEIGAVDKLVQFVYDYEQLLKYAMRHECVDIVESTYAEVTAALLTYGVTAENAISIAEEVTDKDYTKAIHRVVEGAHKKETVVVEPIFKDMLPEEELRQP